MNCVTLHYDNARTGWLQRPVTIGDPGPGPAWGKYHDLCLGAPVRGAVLFLDGRMIEEGPHARQKHTMLFAATSANDVFAFSEQSLLSGNSSPLWQTSLAPASGRSDSNIPPPIGICSTMVLDPEGRRLFAVALTAGLFGDDVYRVYSLSLDTGRILADVPIRDRGQPGRPTFVGKDHDQRGALTLSSGYLYVTFADAAAYDVGPYRGWVVGCAADNLMSQSFFPVTQTVNGGGIWGPGGAAAENGDVYVVTGNSPEAGSGFWSALAAAGKHPGDIADFFEAVVRVRGGSAGFTVEDWYLPTNAESLNYDDLDLGGASALLLPAISGTTQRSLVTSDKAGNVYLLNRDNLGHWGNETWKAHSFTAEVRCAPAYYESPEGEHFVFLSAHGTPGLIAFKVDIVGGVPRLTEAWQAHDRTNALLNLGAAAGSPLVVSRPGTAEPPMVWILDGGGKPVLHAFDARDGLEIFSSSASPLDAVGDAPHYPPMSCTNRSVFVATTSGLACYRLPWQATPGDSSSWTWNGVAQDPATIPRLLMAWKGIPGDDGIYWLDGASPWIGQQRVPGVGTSDEPSVAFFENRFFMAWKGASGDDAIWWSSFDGSSWAGQQQVPGVGTSNGPALAVFNGRLFMAWKGASGDDAIWWSSFDGSSWAGQQQVPGVGTSDHPALCVLGNRLFMAWMGAPGDDAIWWSSFDGSSWAPQRKIGGVGTSNGPSMAQFRGDMFMTWKGIQGDDEIWWSIFDGTSWLPQQNVAGVGTSVGAAVASDG